MDSCGRLYLECLDRTAIFFGIISTPKTTRQMTQLGTDQFEVLQKNFHLGSLPQMEILRLWTDGYASGRPIWPLLHDCLLFLILCHNYHFHVSEAYQITPETLQRFFWDDTLSGASCKIWGVKGRRIGSRGIRVRSLGIRLFHIPIL